MRPDIVNLRQFYSSQLGRRVKARLARVTLAHWPSHTGKVVVGIGYTLPMLRVIERTTPGTVIALMPAVQGALYWPVHSENRAILADEMRPPFAPNSISRIVMLHTLEHAEKPDELLQILWQILEPGGQLLIMVPNSRGPWVRGNRSPFTGGKFYHTSELKTLLSDTHFTLRETSTALFAPPSTHPLWLRTMGLCEMLGKLLCPGLGGLIVIEAEKQIYAGVGERISARAQQSWAEANAPVLNTSPNT